MELVSKIVWDIETGEVLERETVDYEGPIAFCCGGPTQQQKDAATSQTNLDNQLASQYASGSAVTNPFYTDLATKGLPNFNADSQYQTSNLAKQVNQQQAQQKAKMAGYGDALPSGFAASASRDMAGNAAETFDQNQQQLLQQQLQAKLIGAQGLNPLASASLAQGGNNSIMQAPLQNNFWSNLIGGMVQGGAQVGSAALKYA